jgi:hypothetical protein
MPPQQGQRLLDVGNGAFGISAQRDGLSYAAADIGPARNKRNAVALTSAASALP